VTLGELFDKYGSDKAHVGDGHCYHEFYELAVPSSTRVLVEVGLGSHIGFNNSWGSARAWLEWLQGGVFYGFDVVEPPAELLEHEKFVFTLGDQSVRADLERFASSVVEPADVIIDDGSHVASHQLLTLEVLWPSLKPGGYYVVEDLYKETSAQCLTEHQHFYRTVGNGRAAVLRKPL